MWPDWTFYGMAMLAAFLFGVLCVPMGKEINCTLADWWIARRNQQRITQWEGQRAARMREGVR